MCPSTRISAALCRGLIEAQGGGSSSWRLVGGFPRLYAAASLKLDRGRGVPGDEAGFPRLYAAASLKPEVPLPELPLRRRFPRLYAAASLKPGATKVVIGLVGGISAALCRGLIEAAPGRVQEDGRGRRFPRLYAAASLKQLLVLRARDLEAKDFRGFMPRPH